MPDVLLHPALPTLIACLAVPLVGPLLQRLQRWLPAIPAILDGFVFISIGGLILLDVLPHAYASVGMATIPLALMGLFVPTFLEKAKNRIGARAHTVALAIGLSGLILHSFVDGAGLVTLPSLSVALILHRLPVGLAVWVLLRRSYGRVFAITGLVILNTSTIAGFTAALEVSPTMPNFGIGLFAAVVGGSLLHVVVHMHPEVESIRRWRFATGVGGLIAFGLLFAMLDGHGHRHGHDDPIAAAEGFADRLLSLSLDSAPALLFAYLAAGLIFGFLPKATVGWLGRGRSLLAQSWRGMVFGLPLPICSCGIVPIYQSLIRRGVPLATGVTLLVSAPELGIDAIFLTATLTGGTFTILRVTAAAVLALAIGVTIGRLRPPISAAARDDDIAERPRGFVARLRASGKAGFGEIVDHTGPWLVLGLAIAAIAAPLLNSEWLRQIPTIVQVPALALLGMPVYVCASGATPLIAVLLAGGVSPGAALAFLLTGPATNITTFGVMSKMYDRRLAFAFAATMATLAILIGFLANLVPLQTIPPNFAEHDASPFSWACMIALVFLFVLSLLRQGPRGFVGQVLARTSRPDSDAASRSHDHAHAGSGDACC